MNKRNGFSFVEVLIVMVMMGVMLAGGVGYFNNFSNKKSVEETASVIASQIEIARSHAKTNRLPGGQLTKVNYVRVLLAGGRLSIVSDIGNTYSSLAISNNDVLISNLEGCDLCFEAGSNKLVSAINAYKPTGYEVSVTVTSKRDDSLSRSVIVSSTGMVRRVSL